MSKNTIKTVSDINGYKSLFTDIPINQHFHLDACYDFVLPNDWGFENRINHNFHVAFVKAGDVLYELGKEKVKVDKGMIIFVSRNFCHSRILNTSFLPKMVLVRFNLVNNSDLLPATMNCEPFAFAYAPKDPQKYHPLFSTMVRYFRNPVTEQRIPIANSILHQLLFEIYDDLNILQQPVLIDPRIEKTIKYAKENIHCAISIEKLSTMAGLSENHYRCLFEKFYDMNPKQYFMRIRAQSAFELLTETSRSIKDISSQLGYSDQYAFSKQFKSVFGKSPSQVRSGR